MTKNPNINISKQYNKFKSFEFGNCDLFVFCNLLFGAFDSLMYKR